MTQGTGDARQPSTAGDTVAAQVRKYRLRRNWSVRQLAEECARLGAPQLTAASLGNIERGQDKDAKRRRRGVTVDELVALARALRVAPLLLLLPLDAEPYVELVPGERMAVWDAARWFTGEAYPDGELGEDYFAVPVYLNRQHHLLVEHYVNTLADQAFAQLTPGERKQALATSERIVDELRGLRAEMRRHGVPLPVLPEALQQVDSRPRGHAASEAEVYLARRPGADE